MAKTYDVKCHELAEHFLANEPCRDDPSLYERHSHTLALAIQQAVERDGLRKAMEDIKAETINVRRSQEERMDRIYEIAYAALNTTTAVSDADRS